MVIATPKAQLILATRNAHKVGELRDILQPLLPGVDMNRIQSAAQYDIAEPIEDAVTFAGNALIKARQIAEHTGIAAIADDSGICVDVLGGAPGIFSARWCGKHGDDQANLDLLLAQLCDVKDEYRTGYFMCAAALVLPDGREFVREGRMIGRLRYEAAGEGGFGYDPIFQPDGYAVTSAELDPAEKNRISHRGRAFTELAPLLAEYVFTQ
ncbi:RdgB/HAM1 family non-canonical purine NTP pyrophosphatase [Arcanobacterium pinnipediorum]|uniref:dITP/XTP pyrophosphatase n=1 Tax=Arcanobacterium pinnipediorum TaxID=1503041 RepID=A0ABY5AFT6_9ACTO|nr:RdgB/HAM1 family non-canonical purine NTP pyrophosphatase [Arcanobacterium pinnipediorum]USR78861.1 RdgB/HAM1 family non-canonical purine NTP pyrophosphatase [Arcanobacterium pinnipediorum]